MVTITCVAAHLEIDHLATLDPFRGCKVGNSAHKKKGQKEMNDRDDTIKRIKTALERRSKKKWSVTGGRGAAWGWITIDAPPARRTWGHRLKAGAFMNRPEDYEGYDTQQPGGYITPQDKAELAKLLGLETVHDQGVSIAASNDYYREYIDRAEGRTPAKIAQPYWD